MEHLQSIVRALNWRCHWRCDGRASDPRLVFFLTEIQHRGGTEQNLKMISDPGPPGLFLFEVECEEKEA